MKLLILGILLFSIVSCASMQESVGVGRLDVQKSTFDGKKEVTLQPAFIKPTNGITFEGGVTIKLGLSWMESHKDNVLVLVDYSSLGNDGIKSISGLSFNIDSRIVEAVSIETFTSFDYQKLSSSSCGPLGCESGVNITTSTKRFVISTKDLLAMRDAKDVKIKISIGNRTYHVADLKAEYPGNLRLIDKLPSFLKEIGY